jgi:DNA-binding CsgD family transcriptional regulator
MSTPKKTTADPEEIGCCDYPPQEVRRSLPDYAADTLAATPPVMPTEAGLTSPVVTTANFTADPRMEKALRIALEKSFEDPDATGTSAVLSALAPREKQTLLLAAQGLSNKEIAQSLNLRPITVAKALSRAYRKLGAQNRAEAVHKLLSLHEE